MGILQGFFISPLSKVQATGGTIIDDGGYRIHVFTGTGPFNVSQQGFVEYLVVAGGGGSGANSNGTISFNSSGAGAGGFRTGTNFPVTVQDYTITIGSGGPGGTGPNASAGNGNPSSFSSIISSGGGTNDSPGGSG